MAKAIPLGGVMRFLFSLLLLAGFSIVRVQGAELISSGMELEAVTGVLERHCYEVSSEKYGLAIVSLDRDVALEFCRIDDQITLVIGHDRASKRVDSLSLYFIGDGPKVARSIVVRDVIEMRFEEAGVYAVKLRRKAEVERKR
ncbi:MAG: hypothetical protein WD971_13905 [Pirellulales bacterium]